MLIKYIFSFKYKKKKGMFYVNYQIILVLSGYYYEYIIYDNVEWMFSGTYEYHGCFSSFGLPLSPPGTVSGLTIHICITECTNTNYCYAGVQVSGCADFYIYTTQKKFRISCAYFFVLATSNSRRL